MATEDSASSVASTAALRSVLLLLSTAKYALKVNYISHSGWQINREIGISSPPSRTLNGFTQPCMHWRPDLGVKSIESIGALDSYP